MKNEKYLIVGAGRSGIAAAKMLLTLGKEIVIYDGNTDLDTEAVKAQIGTGEDILFILGAVHKDDFDGIDKCVVSPGVALHTPVMQTVIEKGIPVIGEIELAYLYDKGQVIALTGTNG